MSHKNMSETLAINSTISHYRIIEKIGAGGSDDAELGSMKATGKTHPLESEMV